LRQILIADLVVRGKGTLLINLRSLHRGAVSEREFYGSLERELFGGEDSAEGGQEHTKKKQSKKA
jgi:hypothetical protein